MPRTGRPPRPAEERFFKHVVQNGDCWEWTGTTNSGYGHFAARPDRVYAHRWSYEFFVAPIPPGLTIDHLCRNRRCVNPEHLEPVPQRVNTLRGPSVVALNAIKTHCKHGHEFTPENTLLVPGGRQCRTCRLAIYARYHARKKAAAHV